MADNTQLNLGSGGDLISTDDLGGVPNVKVQRVKLMLGTDGVNAGDVSSSNPIPSLEKRGDGEPAAEGSFSSNVDSQILAASASRKSFSISNDSDQDLFIRYGSTAVSTSSYRVKIPPGGFYSDDGWAGEVRGILAAPLGSGQVRFSEET